MCNNASEGCSPSEDPHTTTQHHNLEILISKTDTALILKDACEAKIVGQELGLVSSWLTLEFEEEFGHYFRLKCSFAFM